MMAMMSTILVAEGAELGGYWNASFFPGEKAYRLIQDESKFGVGADRPAGSDDYRAIPATGVTGADEDQASKFPVRRNLYLRGSFSGFPAHDHARGGESPSRLREGKEEELESWRRCQTTLTSRAIRVLPRSCRSCGRIPPMPGR